MFVSLPRWVLWVVPLLVGLSVAGELVAAPISSETVLAQPKGKKYPEVDAAVAKFTSGNLQEARQEFEVARMRHPELSSPEVMLARLFFATGRVPNGRVELEQALAKDPNDAEAYDLLGNLALADRRFTEAGMLYDKVAALAAAMDAKSPRKNELALRAEAGLATVAESRKNWDEAQKHLAAWIALDAKDYRPRVRMGQALFQSDKSQEAYQEFQAAAKLSDQAPTPEIMMGRLYQQKEDKTKAAEWMKLALERAPQDPEVQVGLAEWNWEQGQLDAAKLHADEALKLKPDMIEAKVIRGLVARFQKDYLEAEKQFQSAHLLSPANFTAANQLALVLSEQDDEGKLRRARELGELNVRQYPNNTEAAAALAGIYFKVGRTDDAAQLLQAVANAGAMSGDAAYVMGQILAARNNKEEAMRLLRAALDARGPFANREAAQALYDKLSKK
jgi:tetratricopeptide (TPR) repeat protein